MCVEYDMDTLRNKVAVVLQQNVLFSGTILENLRWGDKTLPQMSVLRPAKWHAPMTLSSPSLTKYNTYIEQGGTNVSGGPEAASVYRKALLKSQGYSYSMTAPRL